MRSCITRDILRILSHITLATLVTRCALKVLHNCIKCAHVFHSRYFMHSCITPMHVFVAARLKSQAQDIEFRAELETQQQLRDAELAFQKAQSKLELEKSRQLSNLEVHT